MLTPLPSEISRQGSEAPAEDPCRASQRSMAREKNCAAPRRPEADDKDVNFSQRSDRTLLRMRFNPLDGMAGVLAGLECPFEIRRPEELRASVRGLSERLAACV